MEYNFPKYQHENVTIYNGDNMELLAATPDKYYDIAIVDPPYGINVNKMNMGGRKTVKPNKKTWDENVPSDSFFNELFRVSKNQIIWGGNYFKLPQSQYFAIWDKGETMYGRGFAEAELAWASNGGTRIFKKSPNQLDRIHVTQKPVELYDWIYQNYVKDGGKVLDTHSGSASNCIAAHKNKDKGIEITAIEIDKDDFDASVKRFKQYSSQKTIFDL